MKISNFRFFVRKIFQNFSISNFENGFSSWKINIFYPDFFSWQGMIILHRKTTPALSLFDLSQERHGQTSTNPCILPSIDTFSREASCSKWFLMVLQSLLRLPRACLPSICPSSFVFWGCEFRFSTICYQIMRRWFPGSFSTRRYYGITAMSLLE